LAQTVEAIFADAGGGVVESLSTQKGVFENIVLDMGAEVGL
jgi:hypothetical protein